MSYTPSEDEAGTRLTQYNDGAWDPASNPLGFDAGGNQAGVFTRMLKDVALFLRATVRIVTGAATDLAISVSAAAASATAAAGSAASASASADRAEELVANADYPNSYTSASKQGSLKAAVAEAIARNIPLRLAKGEYATLKVPSQKATIQAAIDTAASWEYATGSGVIIKLAAGIYTAGGFLAQAIDGLNPFGLIAIEGQSDPTAVVVRTTNAMGFQAQDGAVLHVRSLSVETSGGGSCLYALRGGTIFFRDIVFGPCAVTHVEAIQGGMCVATGNYQIRGGGISHLHAAQGGIILNSNNVIAITGTPAFSSYFIGVAGPGYAQCINQTYIGQADGKRFLVHNNGFIDIGNISTSLDSANESKYFPGSAEGYANPFTGGVYDYITAAYAMCDRPAAFASRIGVNGAGTASPFQTAVADDLSIRMIEASGSAVMQSTDRAQGAVAPLRLSGTDVDLEVVGGFLKLTLNRLGDFSSDAQAASAGVPIGAVYRSGSVLKIRVA